MYPGTNLTGMGINVQTLRIHQPNTQNPSNAIVLISLEGYISHQNIQKTGLAEANYANINATWET